MGISRCFVANLVYVPHFCCLFACIMSPSEPPAVPSDLTKILNHLSGAVRSMKRRINHLEKELSLKTVSFVKEPEVIPIPARHKHFEVKCDDASGGFLSHSKLDEPSEAASPKTCAAKFVVDHTNSNPVIQKSEVESSDAFGDICPSVLDEHSGTTTSPKNCVAKPVVLPEASVSDAESMMPDSVSDAESMVPSRRSPLVPLNLKTKRYRFKRVHVCDAHSLTGMWKSKRSNMLLRNDGPDKLIFREFDGADLHRTASMVKAGDVWIGQCFMQNLDAVAPHKQIKLLPRSPNIAELVDSSLPDALIFAREMVFCSSST